MAFLDSVGLAHFKEKLQGLFASKEEVTAVDQKVESSKIDYVSGTKNDPYTGKLISISSDDTITPTKQGQVDTVTVRFMSDDGITHLNVLDDKSVSALITKATSGNSGIPKTGDRGSLAGWESTAKAPNDNSPSPYNKVTQDSPDVMYATDGETTIDNSNPSKSWTKVIAVKLESTGDPSSPDPTGTVSFVLGNRWKWIGGKVPEISAGILVLHWNNGYGVASFIARD